jgi:hypothetical protein
MQTIKQHTRKDIKGYSFNKISTITKKDFIEKWGIDDTSVYYYVKRFPEIKENTQINYSKLNTIIQGRIDIKEQVKNIMIDKKPKEIEWLFEGKNKKTISHIFIYQLYSTIEQILVRDSNYKKYLQIIEHFKEIEKPDDITT